MARVLGTTKNQNEINPVSQSVSQFQPKKKAAKGTVVIQVFRERLRLCWSYIGKRYYLYIGLPDSKLNRVNAAEPLARRIEGDIATGNFDPSLKKYKPDLRQKLEQTSAVELFGAFIQFKSKKIGDRTLDKYRATLKNLKDFFGDKPAIQVGLPENAMKFVEYLPTKVSLDTAKTYLTLISACWDWGLSKDYVESNPWTDLVSSIKVPPKQPPSPFSREEIGAIIQAFRSDRYYYHYADYVEFLFGTGCRTGEAIGLQWKHISDDCSTVWIGESLSRGIRKSTKTNKARVVTLTSRLQAMLSERKPQDAKPDDLVFTTPNGNAIDDHNFRNRAWKTVLTRLEINYRKPYATRHSLISHALDLGMNPVMVAQLTGHDVQVLFKNYAGNVNSRPRLPEI
jgi:integrase